MGMHLCTNECCAGETEKQDINLSHEMAAVDSLKEPVETHEGLIFIKVADHVWY